MSRYTMGRLIGHGGMAEVYEARRDYGPGLVELVACKKIKPGLERDPDVKRRFGQEAHLGMELGNNHPNLITVYDLFTERDGSLCLIMELVSGCSLRDLHRASKPLPDDVIRRIVRDILSALDHIHERDVLHRDLSPCNVLLSSDGEVKLGDLGLVKDLSASSHSVGFFGKSMYASPEHLRLEGLDHRADLFSLGVILYELLTGSLPFGGALLKMGDKLQAMREQPASLPDSVAVDLRTLTLGLLTVDRAAREPATAREALALLDEFDAPAASMEALGEFVSNAQRSASADSAVTEYHGRAFDALPRATSANTLEASQVAQRPQHEPNEQERGHTGDLITVRKSVPRSWFLTALVCMVLFTSSGVYMGLYLRPPKPDPSSEINASIASRQCEPAHTASEAPRSTGPDALVATHAEASAEPQPEPVAPERSAKPRARTRRARKASPQRLQPAQRDAESHVIPEVSLEELRGQ